MVMSDTLPLAEVKAKLSEMVDRVERTHDRITLTRNGRPAAVLISPEELASLEDTLELLADPDAMKQLRRSRSAHAAGDYVTGDELRGKYPRGDGAGHAIHAVCHPTGGPTTQPLARTGRSCDRRVPPPAVAGRSPSSRRAAAARTRGDARARRGAYRIVYEMVDDIAVVVGPPDRSPGDVYRPR